MADLPPLPPIPTRAQWNALPEREAQALLLPLLQERLPQFALKGRPSPLERLARRLLPNRPPQVESHLPQFELKGFERFSKFGMSTTTAVLDCAGCEFVFVPGDTVTLGLDRWTLAPENKQAMLEDWEDCNDAEAALDQYLRKHLSPVRTAAIGPMLVERAVRETGYFPVSLDDERLVQKGAFDIQPFSFQSHYGARQRDERFMQKGAFARMLQKAQKFEGEDLTWIVDDAYRLEKRQGTLRAFLYEPASYDELLASVARSGFRLPTEDEWEYLCGGGTRSLYPWGDNIDYSKNYKYTGEKPKGPLYLDTPNPFGLIIANDPYRYEVMMDSEYFLKGGDGGGNCCGGLGWDLTWLPTSTYFREPSIFHRRPAWKNEITGRYTFTRRIIRL